MCESPRYYRYPNWLVDNHDWEQIGLWSKYYYSYEYLAELCCIIHADADADDADAADVAGNLASC